MTNFMIGYAPFILIVQPTALSFRAGNHLFHGIFQIDLSDLRCPSPCGQQRRFIDHIGQIGTGKTGRLLGDPTQIDFG